MFMFYCVVRVCNVGYVCSFRGDQIFVNFVSFLSMLIVCISYNTGKSALPDIYTQPRGYATPESECVYIRQSTSACVITT